MRYPKEFRTVKQPARSRICSPCIAAMATGDLLPQVMHEMQHDNWPATGQLWYSQMELMIYLAKRGIGWGLPFYNVHDDINTNLFVESGVLSIWKWHHSPAVFNVPSIHFDDATHFVFWDGEVVRDPDPEMPDVLRLESIQHAIIDITPLTYFDDGKDCDAQ